MSDDKASTSAKTTAPRWSNRPFLAHQRWKQQEAKRKADEARNPELRQQAEQRASAQASVFQAALWLLVIGLLAAKMMTGSWIAHYDGILVHPERVRAPYRLSFRALMPWLCSSCQLRMDGLSRQRSWRAMTALQARQGSTWRSTRSCTTSQPGASHVRRRVRSSQLQKLRAISVDGPGGSYHHFAGKDASRAFVTGCFRTHLTHDLRGLSDDDLKVRR